MAALESQDFAEAIESFARAIANDPRVAAGYRYRARAYLGMNDRTKAIADYDSAIRLKPNDAQLHAERAAELLKQRRFLDAIADCDAAVQHEAGRVDVLVIRARAHASQGNSELAFADFQTAISVDPDRAAEYLTFRAKLHLECGNLQSALADANTALRVDGEHCLAYEIRALVHCELGDWPAAKRDYSEASRDEGNLSARMGRLSVLHRLEEWSEAILVADELLAKSPGLIPAYDVRARAHLALGQHDRAFADFTAIVDKLPNRAIGYSLRGQAYEQSGDYLAALQNYLQASNCEPNDAGTLNQLAWLYATAEAVKNPIRAKEFATRACERSSFSEPAYLDTLAAACAELGDLALAITWMEKAILIEDREEYRATLAEFRARCATSVVGQTEA